ncbi:MAG: hypothetical protein OXG85_07380 [Chloroflexi bacterium]|nr:hypothetical protein [Chloroflexota bacterium]
MSDEQNTESFSQERANRLPDVPIPPELIQDIPEEKRRELIQYVNSIYVEHSSGPMPPPSMLASYTPEVQQIIVDESVQHGRHRMTLEQRVIDASIHQERRGMWLGFVLALSLILCGTAIILSGYSAEGLALIAADALAIAVVYVHDRRGKES